MISSLKLFHPKEPFFTQLPAAYYKTHAAAQYQNVRSRNSKNEYSQTLSIDSFL